MKLVNLKVFALHGCYDYDVDFNSDVTFIYGENGCGKTTLLNILEFITTGRLFRLFGYDFQNIILIYAPGDNLEDTRTIKITLGRAGLNVTFNGESCTVPSRYSGIVRYRDGRDIDLEDMCFHRYKILREIRSTFNHVYLPLNRVTRSSSLRSTDVYTESLPTSRTSLDSDLGTTNHDILQIERLIRNKYAEIMASITRLNEQFRGKVMKSLLDVNQAYDFMAVLSDLNENQECLSTLQKTKTSYIKMLQELGILSPDEKNDYITFFDDLVDDFNAYKSGEQSERLLNITLKWQEVLKIKKLISLVEATEVEKAEVYKPVEMFVKTINDFINTTDDDKTINVDSRGLISFSTKASTNPVSIQYLSSGEKQIVTFFAYLMFMVEQDKFGIFVVDEPELSLHLAWQKIFVQKTLQVNDKIQLIFATHSPEFVGSYRDKMFKLKRNFTNKGDV